MHKKFSREITALDDPEAVINKIVDKMRADAKKIFKRGAVVGISGGIDSSVCFALAAKAYGPEKVLGIMMPEQDSSPESEMLARELAAKYNVECIKEDITGALSGFKCYERRDEAVKNVFPEYDPAKHKMKIGIKTSGLYNNLAPLFTVTIIDSNGAEQEKRLPAKEYLQIVAASNFKQRARMSMLYYHADRLNYLVVGTPNKHEKEQGFFVKYGDGGADIMPIGNLYKTEVYQLAEKLGIPKGIIERTPTTDTYTAEQTQEEFFYQLPFEDMDILWYAFEHKYDAKEVAKVMNDTPEHIESIFTNFARKIKTTEYLRMPPIRDYYQVP